MGQELSIGVISLPSSSPAPARLPLPVLRPPAPWPPAHRSVSPAHRSVSPAQMLLLCALLLSGLQLGMSRCECPPRQV